MSRENVFCDKAPASHTMPNRRAVGPAYFIKIDFEKLNRIGEYWGLQFEVGVRPDDPAMTAAKIVQYRTLRAIYKCRSRSLTTETASG